MSTPNRIRELRKQLRISASELARRVGTSQVQISRLERGERQLTVEWMMRISKALECAPEDLLGPIAMTQFEDDATPYEPQDQAVADALRSSHQVFYVTNSSALASLGFGPDEPIMFDTSPAACSDVRTGDVVIVELTEAASRDAPRTIIRQFVEPDLLTTNRPGRNFAFHLEEQSFSARIIGVHRKRRPANGHGAD